MITGAARADAALLLIAANEGVREQSRRHGYLLSLLGLRQVAVVVNKMDPVGYDRRCLREIEAEYRQFLGEFGVEPRVFIPISAREGANVAVTRGETMPWYAGPTVAGGRSTHSSRQRRRPTARCASRCRTSTASMRAASSPGASRAGTLRVGDELVFSPFNKTARRRQHRTLARDCRGRRARRARRAGESVGHHAHRTDLRRARPRRQPPRGRAHRIQPHQGEPLLAGPARTHAGRQLPAQARARRNSSARSPPSSASSTPPRSPHPPTAAAARRRRHPSAPCRATTWPK